MSDREKDRLWELLAEDAVQPFGAEQSEELERLLSEYPEVDPNSLELAAAAVELAYTETEEPLPATLEQRLEQQAASFFLPVQEVAGPRPVSPPASERPPSQPRPLPAPRPLAWTGWAAAAAALVAAFLGWIPNLSPVEPPAVATMAPPAEPPSAAQRRAALVSSQSPLQLDWQTLDDPAAALPGGVTGDVVWDTELQEGYLRFVGLAANNPAIEQYQLWIFDSEQDERYPIDGGVFDVPSSGEVVIPIHAKLRVRQPVMFAVTVEKPGGVVVSSRKRLPVLAQVG